MQNQISNDAINSKPMPEILILSGTHFFSNNFLKNLTLAFSSLVLIKYKVPSIIFFGKKIPEKPSINSKQAIIKFIMISNLLILFTKLF